MDIGNRTGVSLFFYLGNYLQAILRNPLAAANKAETVWARLFRTALYELKVDRSKFNRLMEAFCNNPANRFPADPAKRRKRVTQLQMALANPKMTYRQFQKALKFLNPTDVNVDMTATLRLGWSTGRTDTIIVSLNDANIKFKKS